MVRKAETAKKWRDAHRQELVAYFKAYNEAHKAERRAKGKLYYAANRVRILERDKAYNFHHRDEKLAYFKHYNATHKEIRRDQNLRRYYGLGSEEFNKLLHDQGDVCAICKTNSWGHRGPELDHDHGSKKIRGILCSRCNLTLGRIEESLAIAQGIVDYLNAWKDK